jgi:colanic acid biosynthesis glycosyl transferase WcaI
VKFILISLNYSPELTGIGKYNAEMCTELAKDGFDVSAIVAPPYYPDWKVHKGYSKYKYSYSDEQGVDVIRCPLYVPKNVTTLKRILHLSSFAVSSGLVLVSKIFTRPDVVFLVQPTLFCAPLVLLFCKLTGAKSVMHIQDYEVDALFSLKLMGKGRISSLAKNIECWVMKRFDIISTISNSMMNNAKTKGVVEKNILYFPNWSDINFITPEINGGTLKKEWGYDSADRIILYSGNIGKKQGLEIVLDAAQAVRNEKNIKFILVGTGAHFNHLRELSQKMGLSNLSFKPLMPWKRVPEMLALADIHLVIQKKGIADVVLPSKLTNILAVGGYALVAAEKKSELGQLNEMYPGIYKRIEPECLDSFISGLNELLTKNLCSYNSVARVYADRYLDKDKILSEFAKDLKSIAYKNK